MPRPLRQLAKGMNANTNTGVHEMQHLNGMELVALSIHVDETRAAREFKRFMRTNWRDVVLVVLVYVAVCASML